MRSASLLLLFSVWMLGGCRDNPEKVSSDDTQEQGDAAPEGDFYKRLSGTIAGKRVVAHLHRMGDWVGGSYAYTAVGIPISLVSWNDTTPGDNILELQEYNEAGPLDESYTYPRLHLTLTSDGAKGTWISADSGRRFSVELEEDYDDGSIRLEAISFFDSARLIRSRPLPKATASYSTVAPAEDDEDRWVIEAIKSSFGEPASSAWSDLFGRVANEYFAGYQRDVIVDTTNASDADRAMHNWSTESRATVLMNEKHWLVLRRFSADYTGGAHGNHGSSFLVLDRKDRRQWTLSDVVVDTATLKSFLNTAAADRWRLAPEAPFSDRLLVTTVPVTTNFYPTQTGLGFVYNPYEIASYADGEVHLFIPYKRIMFLLTEDFKQRMGLANSTIMRG